MAKGTNAKIKELKGVKPEKITTEQLQKVQGIIGDINIQDGTINYKEDVEADKKD